VAATLAVQAQTADTYVVIRGLQHRLAVARDQVTTQTRLTDTIRLQFNAGVAPELQLNQAEGALAQVKATVPDLESGLENAMNALDVLLARQPGASQQELATVTPMPQAPNIGDAGGPADLLRRRPDLIAAERELVASNARIGEAISEYYPKFSLSGLIGTSTTTAGHQFSSAANQAQGVLGLRWRLFDFGRVDADIRAAKGKKAEALAAYRLAVLRASEDVEDALTAVVKRDEQATILAGGETSLAKAEVAAEKAYEGGAISLIEVLDANSRLLATRDAKVRAQTESVRATIASFRALGGGWNPDEASRTASR
jgi:outer membrane protein TolC